MTAATRLIPTQLRMDITGMLQRLRVARAVGDGEAIAEASAELDDLLDQVKRIGVEAKARL